MVCCFPPVSLIIQRYLNGLSGYFHRSCNLEHIVSFGIYCSVLEWGRGLVGWGGRLVGWGGLISNLNSVRLQITAVSWEKGYSCYISFFTNFALIYWICHLEETLTDFGIYCSVLEWGRGLMSWGGLISNLNSVRLRFTAASWKKGYTCYISFFINFALIYWTCLIRFGGKSHRFWNLLLCLGMGGGDW